MGDYPGSANQHQVVRCFQVMPLGQFLQAGCIQGGSLQSKAVRSRWIGKRAALERDDN